MTLWKPCLWVYRSVTGSRASSSDRYAIRTRNLQDWNLTRYRCANRSEACKEGRGRGMLEDALERVVLAARAPSQVRLHSLYA